MEQEQYGMRVLTLRIKEVNGKYVLRKDELLALLNQYRELLGLLNKLLDERQRMEFLLAEYRLKKPGISEAKGYLN